MKVTPAWVTHSHPFAYTVAPHHIEHEALNSKESASDGEVDSTNEAAEDGKALPPCSFTAAPGVKVRSHLPTVCQHSLASDQQETHQRSR